MAVVHKLCCAYCLQPGDSEGFSVTSRYRSSCSRRRRRMRHHNPLHCLDLSSSFSCLIISVAMTLITTWGDDVTGSPRKTSARGGGAVLHVDSLHFIVSVRSCLTENTKEGMKGGSCKSASTINEYKSNNIKTSSFLRRTAYFLTFQYMSACLIVEMCTHHVLHIVVSNKYVFWKSTFMVLLYDVVPVIKIFLLCGSFSEKQIFFLHFL